MARRAIIIVLDGVGIGELPDAYQFGDSGSDTLGNLSRLFPDGLRLPNLARLGLGNIAEIQGVAPGGSPDGAWGKCTEASAAKDTIIGHWEIAGLLSETPFPTYPNGFPPEVIQAFESEIGAGTLGNYPASGTEIIQRLGDEHVATRRPIVYTSADSVFQIAAHEEIYPPEELYRMCRIARRLLDGEHRVSRVIARPFVGNSGHYERTRNRHDFSVPPPSPTLLDVAKQAGYETVGIGKIGDIFAHQGLSREVSSKDNEQGVLATLMQINEAPDGIIFTNLVDFDMLYGHRNDAEGFRKALEAFDSHVPALMQALRREDLLVITADHGCDPTTASTDHSREFTPLLAYSKRMTAPVDLGTRDTFADIAATLAEFLGLEAQQLAGQSFLGKLGLHSSARA